MPKRLAWYVSILRRLFRRGPDPEAANAVIDMLAKRRVSGRPAEDADSVVRELHLPRGTRTLAVIELDPDAAPLRYVVASRIGGESAGHMGKITVTGIHVTLDRSALPDEWPGNWATSILAQPEDRGSFAWRPANATAAGAAEVCAWLAASDRVARLVNVVLNEPQTLQVEVAPSDSRVRVAAHHTGGGLPQPTTVEAVLNVARTIAGTET